MEHREQAPDGRVPRKKPTHDVDFLVPINLEKNMADDIEIHGESCFGFKWDMKNKWCIMCNDKEVCGVQFHAQVKKLADEFLEGKPTPLDLTDFEGINRNTLLIWLKTKPRTFDDMLEMVAELSNCSDEETVKFWCKSFLKDNEQLGVKNRVIFFKR